ncbi:hypothetical protein [Endozoicomonas sp. Mp262]|uniref:hypothetical protein n=1 Tax=Endozoicomonas sp. Mp262 TaxID=2919499 RepID=UPI0021D8AC12
MKLRKLYFLLFLSLPVVITPPLLATVYVLDAFQDIAFAGVGELENQTLTVTYAPSSISECSIETVEGHLWTVQNKSNRVIEAANKASINSQEMVCNVSWPELVSATAVYAGQNQQERDKWRYLKLGLDSSKENFLFTDTDGIWFKIFNSQEESVNEKVYLKVAIHSSHDSLHEQAHKLYVIFDKNKNKLKLQALHLFIIPENDIKLVQGFQLEDTPDKFLKKKPRVTY